jgi:geranylgeranyl pyrophosphate synthase
MHNLKTGALIQASVELGALSAHCRDTVVLEALREYARCIGLAFQVQDDILDVVSDTKILGKPQGSDIARNKPTYVSLLGLAGARAKADSLIARAHQSLLNLDADTTLLRDLAAYITARQH